MSRGHTAPENSFHSTPPIGSHTPVLLDEVVKFMEPASGKNFIDATGGPGNVSRALLTRNAPDGRVLTIDCDPRALEQQEEILDEFDSRSVRVRGNFSSILDIARMEGFIPADGAVYDLGVSSGMLDDPSYGMSIRHDAPLDMRFDPDRGVSACDLVNGLSEKELVELLRGMDEARFARRIASAIVRARAQAPIETTGELADLVASAVPRKFHPRSIHVATRTFLALRAAVNSERESLEKSLGDCPDVLGSGGVLVVICYSSFEDRIVKASVRSSQDRWEKLTRKAVRPGEAETASNPRSRSARLRAYRKIA